MKMKGWIYTLIVALFGVFACDNDDDNYVNRDLEDADVMFVEKAALSNMAEIALGNLAASKGSDSVVRAYGQMMVTEHNLSLSELQQISENYMNVDWPESLDSAHLQMKQQLFSLGGLQFDSMYIRSQVNDHQAALTLFETQSASGNNQLLKNYAGKYVPHIQQHLDQADSINAMFSTPRDPEGGN
jgi:putative membrane protein